MDNPLPNQTGASESLFADAVREAREAVECLRLEVPQAVADDVSRKVERLIAVSRPERDPDPHGNWNRT